MEFAAALLANGPAAAQSAIQLADVVGCGDGRGFATRLADEVATRSTSF